MIALLSKLVIGTTCASLCLLRIHTSLTSFVAPFSICASTLLLPKTSSPWWTTPLQPPNKSPQIRGNETDTFLPADATLCCLNCSLSEGEMPKVCPLHSRRDRTVPQQLRHTSPQKNIVETVMSVGHGELASHVFLLGVSYAPSCLVLVLKYTPNVCTLFAMPTPSSLRHFSNFLPVACKTQ